MHGENLSAKDALAKLKSGNKMYMESGAFGGDVSYERREKGAQGQLPYAVVVSCSDSRVIPEAIFSAGIGEIFVVRVAGNGASPSVLGSVEYAVGHLGARLIVVLGHERCGAVGAAMSGAHAGHVGEIVDDIRRAIGDETDADAAAVKNARWVADKMRRELDLPKGAEVVAAMYRMGDGSVEFLE